MGSMTIKYASPLGEYSEKYGQRYYGQAHSVDMDISFNLMNPVNFEDGDEIEFEEKAIREKGPQSKNPGEEYLFLRKVKKVSGSLSLPSIKPAIKESPPSAAVPEYEAGTNARWALKLSVDAFKSILGRVPESEEDHEMILGFANWLLEAFRELKNGGSQVGSRDGSTVIKEAKSQPATNQESTGHVKAKATAERLRKKGATQEEMSPEAANELLNSLKEQ